MEARESRFQTCSQRRNSQENRSQKFAEIRKYPQTFWVFLWVFFHRLFRKKSESFILVLVKLTETQIRKTKPKSKTFRLSDGEGLHLIIRPSGGRSWQLRYRYLDQENTLSLGKFPRVSLSEAREKKNNALRLLDDGKNPSTERKREKALAVFRNRNSFGAVAEDWHQRNRDVWSRKHAHDTWRRLENHLLPDLGPRAIHDIEPLELLAVLQKIEKTGTTDISHRVLQICGAVFKFAIISGRAKYNIADGLSQLLKPHRKQHSPTLRERDLPGFLHALEDLQAHEQNKIAFRLLLLTAVRTGEIRFGKWTDIDFEAAEWRIPAEDTKMRTEHIVPLSQQSLSLLRQLKRMTGHQEWMCPAVCGYRHPVMSANTINHMIDRMGYKGRIVGHGFRSLFSTVLNEHGFNRDAIERQLAHMERNAVRAAYNRAEYLQERRQMMQWWSDFIEEKSPIKEVKRLSHLVLVQA